MKRPEERAICEPRREAWRGADPAESLRDSDCGPSAESALLFRPHGLGCFAQEATGRLCTVHTQGLPAVFLNDLWLNPQ